MVGIGSQVDSVHWYFLEHFSVLSYHFFILSFCTISHFFTQDTLGYFEIIRLLSFYFNYVYSVTRYFILSDVNFLIVASFSCDPWLRKMNALKMYCKTFEKQSPKYSGHFIDLRNNFTTPRSFSGLYIHFIYFIWLRRIIFPFEFWYISVLNKGRPNLTFLKTSTNCKLLAEGCQHGPGSCLPKWYLSRKSFFYLDK